MCISSDEINLLIQNYLQELNYDHTSFSFGCESKIPSNPIAERDVPPGSLVYLVQKGIMYAQMEAAAEEASMQQESMFMQHLNNLKSGVRQSMEIAEELLLQTQKIKIFSPGEKPNEYYLSSQSSLFLEGHQGPVTASAWSPDSKFLATGSTDGRVILWEFLRAKDELCYVNDNPVEFFPLQALIGPKDITSLAWSLNGEFLAVGTFCGSIIVYQKGTELYRLTESLSPVVSLSFNSKNLLISGNADGTVIYSGQNMPISKFQIEGNDLVDVLWYKNEEAFAASEKFLYKLNRNGKPQQLLRHTHNINQIVFSDDKLVLATTSGEIIALDPPFSNQIAEKLHTSEIYSIAALKDTIATGSKKGSLVLTIAGDSTELDSPQYPITSIAIQPSGKYLVTASACDCIKIYSIEQKELLVSFLSQSPINGISWSPDSRFLAVTLHSNQVSVMDFFHLY